MAQCRTDFGDVEDRDCEARDCPLFACDPTRGACCMDRTFRSFFLVAMMAACAADAFASSAHAASAGKTTLSITRSSDMLYVAMSAAVEVNGQKVASLGRGETYTGVVAPGPTVVKVSNWSSPGASSYSFKAAPG